MTMTFTTDPETWTPAPRQYWMTPAPRQYRMPAATTALLAQLAAEALEEEEEVQ